MKTVFRHGKKFKISEILYKKMNKLGILNEYTTLQPYMKYNELTMASHYSEKYILSEILPKSYSFMLQFIQNVETLAFKKNVVKMSEDKKKLFVENFPIYLNNSIEMISMVALQRGYKEEDIKKLVKDNFLNDSDNTIKEVKNNFNNLVLQYYSATELNKDIDDTTDDEKREILEKYYTTDENTNTPLFFANKFLNFKVPIKESVNKQGLYEDDLRKNPQSQPQQTDKQQKQNDETNANPNVNADANANANAGYENLDDELTKYKFNNSVDENDVKTLVNEIKKIYIERLQNNDVLQDIVQIINDSGISQTYDETVLKLIDDVIIDTTVFNNIVEDIRNFISNDQTTEMANKFINDAVKKIDDNIKKTYEDALFNVNKKFNNRYNFILSEIQYNYLINKLLGQNVESPKQEVEKIKTNFKTIKSDDMYIKTITEYINSLNDDISNADNPTEIKGIIDNIYRALNEQYNIKNKAITNNDKWEYGILKLCDTEIMPKIKSEDNKVKNLLPELKEIKNILFKQANSYSNGKDYTKNNLDSIKNYDVAINCMRTLYSSCYFNLIKMIETLENNKQNDVKTNVNELLTFVNSGRWYENYLLCLMLERYFINSSNKIIDYSTPKEIEKYMKVIKPLTDKNDFSLDPYYKLFKQYNNNKDIDYSFADKYSETYIDIKDYGRKLPKILDEANKTMVDKYGIFGLEYGIIDGYKSLKFFDSVFNNGPSKISAYAKDALACAYLTKFYNYRKDEFKDESEDESKDKSNDKFKKVPFFNEIKNVFDRNKENRRITEQFLCENLVKIIEVYSGRSLQLFIDGFLSSTEITKDYYIHIKRYEEGENNIVRYLIFTDRKTGTACLIIGIKYAFPFLRDILKDIMSGSFVKTLNNWLFSNTSKRTPKGFR